MTTSMAAQPGLFEDATPKEVKGNKVSSSHTFRFCEDLAVKRVVPLSFAVVRNNVGGKI